MGISLCILTCGQLFDTERLIASVRSMLPGVEVVIGDNSNEDEWKLFEKLADVWFPIYDSDLWFDGFAAVKQSIVNRASNDWCIIADPDEIWTLDARINAVEAGNSNVYRTRMIYGEKEHGRVFNRKHYRFFGIIHEELYKRTDRTNWGLEAPTWPIAYIEHETCRSFDYQNRKQILYDNLSYRAYQDDALKIGVNSFWYTTYIEQRIAVGFKPITYEEWLRGGKK